MRVALGGGVGYGGALHLNNSSAELSNVTFVENTADGAGGAVYLEDGASVVMYNSIFSGNAPDEVSFKGDGTANAYTAAYCNIEEGEDGIMANGNGTVTWGDGNLDVDPLFVDASNGDYHLSAISPCISAAVNSFTLDNATTYTAPDSDLNGNPRPNPEGTSPDMGAYESEYGVGPYYGPVWYVDGSIELPYGNGGPGAPFYTITQGIAAASSGDTVSVAAATYVETINFNGKN